MYLHKLPVMKALARHVKSCMFSVCFVLVSEPAAPTLVVPRTAPDPPPCGERHIACDLYVTCSNVTIIWHVTDLYPSPNIVRVIKSRRMRWVGHVEHMGERRGVYRVLVEKPEGKKPLGRTRRRWKDNIKLDLLGCGGMDWIDLAQDKDRWRSFMSAVMNLRAP